MTKDLATQKADIDRFLSQKKIAIVGVSRKAHKFGHAIFNELKKRDYRVFPINSQADNIDGHPCCRDIQSLPEPVDALITVVPPSITSQVVRDAAKAGIKIIWMQQGSFSREAAEFCTQNNITVIPNRCLLMFLEPVGSIHKFHRWLWKLFGKYPR